MDTVALRPMTADELAAFRETFLDDWALDLSRVDDLPLPEARQEAIRRVANDLADPPATADRLLFTIVADDRPIGSLWCSIDADRHAFLEELVIAELLRGHGYGRRALELLEADLRARGADRIDLHVYAHNPRAFGLYTRAGYRTTGHKLRKFL